MFLEWSISKKWNSINLIELRCSQVSLKHSQTSKVGLFFWQKLYFAKSCILEFWLSSECTSGMFDLSAKWCIFSTCLGPLVQDRVVGAGGHDSSNILNLYFWHSRFQENLLVCHGRRYSVAGCSTYMILSGVLIFGAQKGRNFIHLSALCLDHGFNWLVFS